MDGERLGWRVGGDDGTVDGGWLRCRGCGGSLQYDDGSRRRRRWYWIPTALLFSWGRYGRWKGAVDVPPSTATVMERHRFGLQPHHPQPPTPSTPPLSPKTTTTTRPSKNTLLPPAQPTPSPGGPPTQRTRLLAELATRTSTYTHTTQHTHTTHTLSESHQPSPSHPSSSTTDPV